MSSSVALSEYKRKRHFGLTPEPKAELAVRPGWSYVIQKHSARRLHYDLRLELDGVLKSWAVPKGPSLDPAVKRLAVHVEDHPVGYGQFEGVIPKGEYGGGTVLLWDTGSWQPIGNPHAGYREGKLKFRLFGQKLQGGWMLVKSRSAGRSNNGKEWLLIKERDDSSQDLEAGDILEVAPLSVISNRNLEAIASARERVWAANQSAPSKPGVASSKQTRLPKLASKTTKKAGGSKKSPASDIAGAEIAQLPTSLDVALATLTDDVPQGDMWLHEIKFDGYRMVCRIDRDEVRFISRNQQDWTDRLKPLIPFVKALGIRQGVLDGEIVSLRKDGTTDFQALQNAFRDDKLDDIHYYVFDLIHVDDYSLKQVSLEERKRLLAQFPWKNTTKSRIHLSEYLTGSGPELIRNACQLHMEGIISKRRDKPYREGRSQDWLKIKCVKREEFVIGGFTDPTGSRSSFGALLVGYYDEQRKLRYAGKVGTGFNHKTLKALKEELTSLEQKASPFSNLSRRTRQTQRAHWVKPVLVAEIAFGSRTSDGKLRHASFQGLRADKPAKNVILEKPTPLSQITEHGDLRRKHPDPTASSPRSKGELNGVKLTSPQKQLYPDDGITKWDLAQYYSEIADWILPHVVNRPLSLVRCPDGIAKESFFQKHPGVGTPATLAEVSVDEKSGSVKYSVVKDVQGLISLAQISVVEIHAWGSRTDNLEKPDRLVFDLDPDPALPWDLVVASAKQIRVFLQELGLESFVKTTGGKGLHLVVPIERRNRWDEAKSFCKLAADTVVAAAPKLYTANPAKAARANKIFIDYLRNGRGATAIVPFSTRLHPGATVSTPLSWKELTPELKSDTFNLVNIRKRLQTLRHDPWQGITNVRQNLAHPLKKLLSIKRP